MINNFIVGIVLYNPSNISVSRIVDIAFQDKCKFIVYDNSETINSKLNNCPNVIYYSSKNNIGLAEAYNFIAKKSIFLGYDYLLNFDQDTIFSIQTLFFVNDVLVLKKKSVIPIISICFRDFKKNTSSFIISNNNIYNYNVVLFSINSGSLYFLKYFDKFTWFNKDFFVDAVDYNFNINAYNFGYKFLEFYNTPGLNHQYEQDDNSMDFFIFKIVGRKYSFLRNYDFLRSHFKLLFKTTIYFQPKHFFFVLKSIIFYVLSQFLFLCHNSIKNIIRKF